MTREEAIAKLKNFAIHAYPNEEFLMAIRALEQEPCTDAISREAVLDAISNEKYHYWALFEYVRQLPPVTPQYTDAEIQKMQELEQAEIQKAYEIGKEEGSSENPNRWIPVSEGLPEVMDGTNGECSDDVLICVEYDEQITISTGFYGYYPNSKSQQGWWSVWAYGCHQLDSKYKVVAWTSLPEPYKASPTGAEGSKE